jgi:hypothetical protein
MTTRAQRLERMIALCPSCHRVKHMGKARIDGKYDAALRHLVASTDGRCAAPNGTCATASGRGRSAAGMSGGST